MSEIISRKEAKALGLVRYCTGVACRYGHVGERYVVNLHCIPCGIERRARLPKKPKRPRVWDIPERLREERRRWRERHRDEIADYQRRYCAKRNAAMQALAELGIEIDA